MFRLPLRVRVLLPRFLFNGTPLAWVCAECGRLFLIEGPQNREAVQSPPLSVVHDFKVHACKHPVLEQQQAA